MNQLEQVEGDLRFVRGALAASDRPKSPAALYFFWAAAVLVGFVLVDSRQALVGPVLDGRGPCRLRRQRAPGLAPRAANGSGVHRGRPAAPVALGRHAGRDRAGHADAGPRHAAVGSLNAVILLILAFGYFTAGVHGERAFLWVGALMGAGYVLVTLVSAYAWTMVGVAAGHRADHRRTARRARPLKRLREAAVPEPAFLELDDLLQHRARIGAAVLLARHDRLSFSRLKELLQETDGNLGANMRKLEDAGYVTVRKEFQDRRPVTWYGLSPKGRRALSQHLAGLRAAHRARAPDVR